MLCLAALIGFMANVLMKNTYPLNLAVSTVENGDAQFEGGRHHWASLTCIPEREKERENVTFTNWKMKLNLWGNRSVPGT